MSRLLRLSAIKAANLTAKATLPRLIISRPGIARVHSLRFLEIHDTLHGGKTTPLRLHGIRLHDFADLTEFSIMSNTLNNAETV